MIDPTEWDNESNEEQPIAAVAVETIDIPASGASYRWHISTNHSSYGEEFFGDQGTRPLTFDMSERSWSYTLCFIASIVLSPFLIFISRLTKKKTGFIAWR